MNIYEKLLEPHTSSYSWRLLWLIDPQEGLYPEKVSNSLIRLGYNGIISSDLPLLTALKALGFKGIFKWDSHELEGLCSLHPEWEERICEKIRTLPSLDAVFFEGSYDSTSYRRHPKARDLLREDLAVHELKSLERGLKGKCPLIYSLPYGLPVAKIPEVLDEAGEGTFIAFSSVEGAPEECHLPRHSLWEVLRRSKELKGTPLLPIMNGGMVGKGEGLWPSISLEQIEKNLTGMHRHFFGGAVTISKSLPAPGSFLEGSLWVLGHSLKKAYVNGYSPKALFESWCAVYHEELLNTFWLEEVWQILKQLSQLRFGQVASEEGRLIADCIVTKLLYLQWEIEKTPDKKRSYPCFKDYFSFFSRDAKRIVMAFLHSRHLPRSYDLNLEDRKESFWTEVSLGAQGKVTVLESPNQGEEGSLLRSIYDGVKGKQ